MPIEKRDSDEIFDTTAESLVDEEPNANPRIRETLEYALLQSFARSLANNQEPQLQDVYNAAYVEDATGEDLTKKARNLGVNRVNAKSATGVATFLRDQPTTTDYTVPSGTTIETVEDNPISFETTEKVVLDYYDGFESGSLDAAYKGDTGSVSVQQSTVDTGTYALELPATSDKAVYRTDVSTDFGDVLNVALNPNGGTVRFWFAVQSTNPAKNHYRVTLDEAGGTVKLEKVDGGSVTTIADTNQSLNSAWHDVAIDWRLNGDITVDVDEGNTDVATISGNDSTYTSGGLGFESGDGSNNNYADEVTSSGVSANIEAVDTGDDGNVGGNTIVAMPSPPTGIDSVTNRRPTGDDSLTDTDGNSLVRGRDRENDLDLRQRVLDTDAVQEGPSGGGIKLALEETEGVRAVKLNTNQTSSTKNGLDPYHSEVLVLGGDTSNIVTTLSQTMSVTSLQRLQGGVNGTKVTDTVESEILDQTVTIPFTRPAEVTFDLTLDVVHTTQFAGVNEVKDTIVDYVGGTQLDDNPVFGLTIGENVLINVLENNVEDLRGVEYANVTLLDTDDDNNDDTTTDADGVPVLSVGSNEVAKVDADNITVNTTAR